MGDGADRRAFTIALAQLRWNPDEELHRAAIAQSIRSAAAHGAALVVLPELTLHPYFAALPGRESATKSLQEEAEAGPTYTLCAALAVEYHVHIIASLFEVGGFNTAIILSPEGKLVGKCRKTHIPGSDGYAERAYFRSGIGTQEMLPIFELPLCDGDVRKSVAVAVPTCYDQWFPELHRICTLKGAELICFPSAIGSEQSAPELDTSETWQVAMRGQAACNGTFVCAVNRVSTGSEEGPLGGQSFFGRSFVCGPSGAVLVDAGRQEGLHIARLELGEIAQWRTLLPLLKCRRPSDYGLLTRVDPRAPPSKAPPPVTLPALLPAPMAFAVPLKMHVQAHVSQPARALFACLSQWSAPYFGLPVETSGSIRTMSDETGKYVERLIERNEREMRFSYSIVESPLPIDQHMAIVKVEDLGAAGCIVVWDMHWRWLDQDDDEGDARLAAEFSKDFQGFIEAAAASVPRARL
jgi:N-carbamoylputrescine amidase